ncbi:leucine-rich repeat-containing protein kinase family protein [Hydrogenophaga sp. 5NK40-0174]|uniref:leucine-rich repeat-containing protein kinase family protein n=1 Tax=Hydrogenophaga sp. 5NK40-0174 TaxID=3127649 RepID=UPI0031053074
MNNTLEQLERGAMAGAQRLDLQAAGLSVLPEAVKGLAGSLEVLNLTGNQLSDLPDWLADFEKLKVVFASHNAFTHLPEVLGTLPRVEVVGLRACCIEHVPAQALAPSLRSLILTENRLTTLPGAMGDLQVLQKLMLTGNALRDLPESLVRAPRLELLRIAANRVDRVPGWLPEMHGLAWLAASGNPFSDLGPGRQAPAGQGDALTLTVDWTDLEAGALLGQGASGRILKVSLRRDLPGIGSKGKSFALKQFKGEVTSDGLPGDEMAASLAVGDQDLLVAGLAKVSGVPEGGQAMLMPLVAADARALAGPPDLDACTRDLYASDWCLTDVTVAQRLMADAAAALASVHSKGLLHGDFYAHNLLWHPPTGAVRLSDFGAAVVLPDSVPGGIPLWQAMDTCAFGIWLGEVAERLQGAAAGHLRQATLAVSAACRFEPPARRPSMSEVAGQLRSLSPVR